MTSTLRIASAKLWHLRGEKGLDRAQDDRQTHIRSAEGAEMSDAKLEQVAAAGGGVHVGSDGANN
jgi:hypothetical protein